LILSDTDIARRVEEGTLKVEPFDRECLTPNGLDLRLGGDAVFVLPGPEYSSKSVEFSGSLELPASSVVLLLTLERLELPLDLVAHVNLRSTYARRGFLIPGTVVDSGYHGRLTLQVHSPPYPSALAKGERFWHLLFHESHTASEGYRGRYQNSEGVVEGTDPR
jgi:deoxycytidine triphosphate deaminase